MTRLAKSGRRYAGRRITGRGGVILATLALGCSLCLSGCGMPAISAEKTVALPDAAGSPAGTGFTCTGLAWDAKAGEFLLGNIGQDLPTTEGLRSTIVRMSSDFSTVKGEINLYGTFPEMKDIQGLCVDGADSTIWFCSFGEGKVRHITREGEPLSEVDVEQPTGIAYDSRTDCVWVLTYSQLIRMSKDGVAQESFDVSVKGQDQLWLDEGANVMYFTGGLNYNGGLFKGDNAVYAVDLSSGEVSERYNLADSWAVEGLYIADGKMYVLNDGYYHSAKVRVNEVCVYDIGE